MKKLITTALVCFLFTSIGIVSGCNTVQGIGKDVSKGGRDLERAAS